MLQVSTEYVGKDHGVVTHGSDPASVATLPVWENIFSFLAPTVKEETTEELKAKYQNEAEEREERGGRMEGSLLFVWRSFSASFAHAAQRRRDS